MKTIEKINQEIAELKAPFIENGKIKKRTEKAITSLNTKVRFLLHCNMYLATNPRQEFVESELDRIQKRLSILEDRYDEWFKSLNKAELEGADPRKHYESENNYATLKRQIKTLKYLLDA